MGSRIKRNAVLAKLGDLLTFVVLGVAFIVTMALSALGSNGLLNEITLIDEWLMIGDVDASHCRGCGPAGQRLSG